jgi:ATP-dependent Clp protease ATP-binding subunit ClpA
LFGKLKSGGHVRVIVIKDEGGADMLGFEYLDGPVTPKPEKIPGKSQAKRRRSSAPRRPKSSGPKGEGGGGKPGSGRGSVPKVPLVKV